MKGQLLQVERKRRGESKPCCSWGQHQHPDIRWRPFQTLTTFHIFLPSLPSATVRACHSAFSLSLQ